MSKANRKFGAHKPGKCPLCDDKKVKIIPEAKPDNKEALNESNN
ncbi:MAG: hypothetical protein PHH85_09110 [Candidatus Methanoperedens sp.]|nr:hypothetical protein [Candidatus Methanoperedens sp.]